MDKKVNPISDIFRNKEIPQLTAVYLIDESHNNKYTRLFHSHDYELELYYRDEQGLCYEETWIRVKEK